MPSPFGWPFQMGVGADDRIRTCTGHALDVAPLPVGLHPRLIRERAFGSLLWIHSGGAAPKASVGDGRPSPTKSARGRIRTSNFVVLSDAPLPLGYARGLDWD